MKAFALVGIDGEVHSVVTDRQQLVDFLANQEFSLGEEIVEFEYNDEPMTERGKELAEKIQGLIKDVRKIHMNKQIGFYEIHVDERLQMIYDMLTQTGSYAEAEPFSFNDRRYAPRSKQPKTDVAEISKVERYAPTLDSELEAHGIVQGTNAE